VTKAGAQGLMCDVLVTLPETAKGSNFFAKIQYLQVECIFFYFSIRFPIKNYDKPAIFGGGIVEFLNQSKMKARFALDREVSWNLEGFSGVGEASESDTV
jgi:hypothetical protein